MNKTIKIQKNRKGWIFYNLLILIDFQGLLCYSRSYLIEQDGRGIWLGVPKNQESTSPQEQAKLKAKELSGTLMRKIRSAKEGNEKLDRETRRQLIKELGISNAIYILPKRD
jgi:hypothetical protein